MLNIRWMITKDLDRVIDIETKSNDYYLNKQDLILLLRRRNVVAMVAEEGGEPIGFMIYELMHRRIHLLDLAISHKHRRIGAGSQLIQKLKDKLSPKRRTKISAEVRESNLTMQLFLKQQDFLAVEVLHEYFTDSQEDAFVMHYNLFEDSAEKS